MKISQSFEDPTLVHDVGEVVSLVFTGKFSCAANNARALVQSALALASQDESNQASKEIVSKCELGSP